jgi:hypothetical protein
MMEPAFRAILDKTVSVSALSGGVVGGGGHPALLFDFFYVAWSDLRQQICQQYIVGIDENHEGDVQPLSIRKASHETVCPQRRRESRSYNIN